MSWLQRIKGRKRGRHLLRRVSPEKARAVAGPAGLAPIPQGGEKSVLAVLVALLAVALLGASLELPFRAWLALGVLSAFGMIGFCRYLTLFRRASLESLPRLVGLAALLLGPLAVLASYERLVGAANIAYLPLSFVALVLAIAWSRRLAVECTVVLATTILLYLALRGRIDEHSLSSLAVAGAGAVAAALSADNVLRRNSLFRLGLLIGLVQAAVAGGFLLLGEVSPVGSNPWAMLSLLTAGGVLVALVTSALLPTIEVLFDVTTGISLLELGNTHEAPLLRKLLIEAPGTFHHSYVVGLLAEAAAEAVGGNALLARVGALYHDIGKLNKPEYFAENSPEARARHKSLAPEMSMLIISSHPRDGLELGRYYGLPREILDFMPEHHGTSLIEYFYEHAKRLRGEDAVSEGDFRYPGPKPQRIETAIVMIADAVEAISRQMPDPSRARLEEMVHKVGMKRLMDGQFCECPMTLQDLDRIEVAMVRVLGAIFHTRATYPKGKPHPLDLSQPGHGASAPALPGALPSPAERLEASSRAAGGDR